MTTAADLDVDLLEALRTHHAHYSPFYQGFLSDHGPMGALALHGLGRPGPEVHNWLADYRRRLKSLADAPIDYQRLLDETREDLQLLGTEALLARDLPMYISGWARNAYHPLIRLAYGYQFRVAGEIAAGLAYLKWCGRDEAVEHLAASAKPERDAAAVFRAMSACATTVTADRRFDDCLALTIGNLEFTAAAVCLPDALPTISRMALQVFDETHNFFALHLVTGAHAFRILYPFAGDLRDEIFTLGILAGYASVGAPEFKSDIDASGVQQTPPNAERLINALMRDDDHDIKLAYSCLEQSKFFADPGYAEVAIRYLSGR